MIYIMYLIKSSLVLGIIYGLYWITFRNDTFHKMKRFILLSGIVLSIILPLLKTDSFQPLIKTNSIQAQAVHSSLIYWELLQKSLQQRNSVQSDIPDTPSLINWILYGYSLATAFFALQLVIRLGAMIHLLQQSKSHITEGYRISTHPQINTPFSFFRWIFLPEALSDGKLKQQVITHELAHIRQRHTVDILLMEVYSVFFWFNPFTWSYRQQVRLNLEFLADESVLKSGIIYTDYQLNLLKISIESSAFKLANHFRHSSLKTRIYMMNRTQSPLQAYAKYVLLPVVTIGLFFLFQLAQARNGVSLSTPISITIPDVPKVITPSVVSTQIPKKVSKSKSKIYILKGVIKDADTGEPIAGANIYPVGQTYGAITSLEGSFTLESYQKNIEVLLNHENYLTLPAQIIKLSDATTTEVTLWLKLKPALSIGTDASMDGPKQNINFEFKKQLEPLYIVDGKKSSAEEVKKIDPSTIQSIDVLKDKSATDKYGDEGKNGVVIITLTTTKNTNSSQKENMPGLMEMIMKPRADSTIQFRATSVSPLYILDGKEIKADDFKKINPDTIEEMEVLKAKSATEAYGDKGKNGVIIITLIKKIK